MKIVPVPDTGCASTRSDRQDGQTGFGGACQVPQSAQRLISSCRRNRPR
jgi:hypothetical protein